MLAYQFGPQILENSSLSFKKSHHIMSAKIVVMSFLEEVGEGVLI
jgi:hypothetical protein